MLSKLPALHPTLLQADTAVPPPPPAAWLASLYPDKADEDATPVQPPLTPEIIASR
jgi:hypothetical protein